MQRCGNVGNKKSEFPKLATLIAIATIVCSLQVMGDLVPRQATMSKHDSQATAKSATSIDTRLWTLVARLITTMRTQITAATLTPVMGSSIMLMLS